VGGEEEDSGGCYWRPDCAKESWWMRKGTTSVGAVVCWLLLEDSCRR